MSETRGLILEGYADENQVAREFDVSIQTFRAWRRRGAGPPYVKGPGGVLYSIEEARAWLRRSLVQPRTKTA